MTEKLSLKDVESYWTEQARKHGASPNASWSDRPVIEMEIRELLTYLKEGDEVLDVGCANGYTTVQLALQIPIRIKGVDYIPEMIETAKDRIGDIEDQLAGNVSFAQGNILKLDEPDYSYDKLLVVRVMINLENDENQRAAMGECLRVLKSGGLLLMSEATVQGWNKLNEFRREWELPEIPMPSFNHYIDLDRLVDWVAEAGEVIDIVDFASSYFVGTRVLKPLLAKAAANGVDVASPHMEWNRFFSMLPAVGDYGTQKLIVIRKR